MANENWVMVKKAVPLVAVSTAIIVAYAVVVRLFMKK